MGSSKSVLSKFLECFKNFDFNIVTNKVSEGEISSESKRESIMHLNKMLQKARKELSKAYKSHKAGKISSEELFDCEWYVHELEEAVKSIKDSNKEI